MNHDKLPEPGTNQRGEKYNPLSTTYTNPPKLDLGRTYGTRDPGDKRTRDPKIAIGNHGHAPEMAAQASEGRGVIGQVHRKVPSPANSAAQAGVVNSGETGMSEDQEGVLAGVIGGISEAIQEGVKTAVKLGEGTEANAEDQGGLYEAVRPLVEEFEGFVTKPMAEDQFASSVPRSVEDQFGFRARPMAESAGDTWRRKFNPDGGTRGGGGGR
jgi:hypothetical protein